MHLLWSSIFFFLLNTRLINGFMPLCMVSKFIPSTRTFLYVSGRFLCWWGLLFSTSETSVVVVDGFQDYWKVTLSSIERDSLDRDPLDLALTLSGVQSSVFHFFTVVATALHNASWLNGCWWHCTTFWAWELSYICWLFISEGFISSIFS